MQLNSDPTAQQQQVLVLLAQGKSMNAAAAAVGIHRNTIANWRRSSESFRNHWHTMQYEQAMHWRDELQSIAQIAVDAILKTLTDEKTPPSVRLRAAIAVLDKVTAVPPAQPDLEPSRNMHNLAQPAQAPESVETEHSPEPCPLETAGLAEPAQCCTTAHLDDQGIASMLDRLCMPPQVHNPAQAPPSTRTK